MKAQSAIFTGIQKPMTIFGLSYPLFILTTVGSISVFGFFLLVGFMPVALIGSMMTFAITWLVLFRRQQKDMHFSIIIFVRPRFWRAKSTRILVPGHPTTKHGKGAR